MLECEKDCAWRHSSLHTSLHEQPGLDCKKTRQNAWSQKSLHSEKLIPAHLTTEKQRSFFDPSTLTTMNNLADAVREQGRYAEAEDHEQPGFGCTRTRQVRRSRRAFLPMPRGKKVCTRRSSSLHTYHHEQPG
uniref:Uncharacterized protein n=1 Tax=Ditylum brightwellii TaxID=49249 RepID=A0A7S4W029_9STRA